MVRGHREDLRNELIRKGELHYFLLHSCVTCSISSRAFLHGESEQPILLDFLLVNDA
jgi:hypothetical protein